MTILEDRESRFVHALAVAESGDKPEAWGDGGRAAGRWQVHPVIVWEYGPDQVGLDWTWNEVFEATARKFFQYRMRVHGNVFRAAAEWQSGVHGYARGDLDANHDARFRQVWGEENT